jgi:hypothetical protein
MPWFKQDPAPEEQPEKSSANNLVARACMCIVDGCECGNDHVYVMRSVKPVNVRCSDCAGGTHPGAYES